MLCGNALVPNMCLCVSVGDYFYKTQGSVYHIIVAYRLFPIFWLTRIKGQVLCVVRISPALRRCAKYLVTTCVHVGTLGIVLRFCAAQYDTFLLGACTSPTSPPHIKKDVERNFTSFLRGHVLVFLLKPYKVSVV